MTRSLVAVLALVAAAVACAAVARGHEDQRYTMQEKIPLFVDNLVPEDNPSESYRYYSLRFCPPPEPIKHKSQTLGEVLQGSRKVYSNYDIRFGLDTQLEALCVATLTPEDIKHFRHAIKHRFHFTMYYDGIQLRGYVGERAANGDMFLYTTLNFKLSFNVDRVIEAAVVPDPASRVKLPSDETSSLKVSFAYTAHWDETNIEFEDRSANNAADIHPGEIEIQWFSIINACVLVVLLTGFCVFIVLKMLNRDFQKLTQLEEESADQESGWKRLHGDVFRFPPFLALFCAILGSGVQILLIFACMLTLAVVGAFYPYGRGTAYAAVIVIYSLTALLAGFTSGMWYKKLGGKDWVHNVLITVTLFVGPLFVVWSFLNTVAIVYDSTAALPFGTIVALFAMYLLVTFPLTLAGAVAGKGYAGDFDAPTKTKFGVREIPEAQWYTTLPVQLFIAGFLPFSAIYIELYYVFISIWGHQLFAPFSILYLVFVILLIVTSCITVALTYLQLSAEDHRWWWQSLACGGSTAFFVFAYCFYFLLADSSMYGFLQLSFYFGYMSLLCYALFLALGTVGFFSALVFVRQIYYRIKSE